MHEIIEKRWSARGYDPTATVSIPELVEILDAGRWAPTWGSRQPVRFIVGVRGDDTFDGLVAGLSRGNSTWAPAASALILVCTLDDPDDDKSRTYASVDVGLAVAQMITQAVASGFNAHPMAGYDADAMRARFAIPEDMRPLVLLAVGHLADPDTVDPSIRERDQRRRSRMPLDEVAFADRWAKPFIPS